MDSSISKEAGVSSLAVLQDAGAAATHIGSLSTDTRAALDKRLRRKFDLRVLPFLTMMHLCSMIDRSNMGNAAVLGTREDLNLTGNRFNIALTLFFIPYVLFETPANMVQRQIGPRIWLCFLTVSFGLVTTCISVVGSFGGLCAARVALGLCESGVLAGIMYTLSSFYRRSELTTRMGYLNAIVTLSGAFGGLLATGLTRVPAFGMLHTWRHIFFFEGLITILVGLSVIFLPNDPASAGFLTEEERIYTCSRLVDESKALASETMNKTTFKRALFHLPTQMVAIALVCATCSMGSLQLFSPTLLRNMGYTGQEAQLMSVPPYVFGAIVCVTVATLSDRFRRRGFFFMTLLAPCIFIGFTLNQFVDAVAARYFGLFLAVGGAFTASPLLLSWSVDNNSGPAVKAIAAAYSIGFGGCGQLLSTWTYRAAEAPGYVTGHSINMAASSVLFIAAATHTYYALAENKKRAAGLRDDRLRDEAQGLDHSHPLFRFTT
ncbi:major facilitator superfamily domain-containing protein [Plectosphaerella plurivora]|uniref:Major facilitator superfamily domain-containing protein n=1 Tax=Plectosphaerella plurivora TaxID=936078 RepID=A0A9P8VJ60_9PEZI|nr:major facilitator superfamily domain-containing protein [Plectosphaerella plurivora]